MAAVAALPVAAAAAAAGAARAAPRSRWPAGRRPATRCPTRAGYTAGRDQSGERHVDGERDVGPGTRAADERRSAKRDRQLQRLQAGGQHHLRSPDPWLVVPRRTARREPERDGRRQERLLDRLPGRHRARGGVRRRPREQGRTGHRRRDARLRQHDDAGTDSQHPPPPRLGSLAGDLRRGQLPPGAPRQRVRDGHPELHRRLREALRRQRHRGRPRQRQRHHRSRRRCARSSGVTSDDRRRGRRRLSDGRVQRGQQHALHTEQRAL